MRELVRTPFLRAAVAAGALAAVASAASCSSSSTPACEAGQTLCGTACVDTATDGRNCGRCGLSCIAGASCANGRCGCPGGETQCLGTGGSPFCANVSTDPYNCGTCGHACGLGTCSGGSCACDAGATRCGTAPNDTCVDTLADVRNCGDCGNACNTGYSCVPSGSPATGTCACVAPPGTVCGTAPAQVCVDTSTDPRNCGACGNACTGGRVCTASACACPAGAIPCGTPAACVNPNTDPANCGACGTRCATGQTCSNGACAGGCTGPTCGGLCCPGTACCAGGTACETEHDNGVGQKFYDCLAVGSWGAVDGLALARDAAAAWAPQGNDVSTSFPCGGTYCLARQRGTGTGGAECGVWCYDGVQQGRGALGPVAAVCACPEQSPLTAFGWY